MSRRTPDRNWSGEYTSFRLLYRSSKGEGVREPGFPVLTGMAQRKRAGLITPRSLDQNGLPVFTLCQFYRNWCDVDITQRTRDGANLFQGREFESHYQYRRIYSSSYDTARAHFLISLQRFGGKLISPYPTHFPVSHSFPVSGFRVGLRA